MSRRRALPAVDLGALTACADPYPCYAAARRSGPVIRGGAGQWVVTRHQEVAALLRDPRLAHEFPEEYHRLIVGDGPTASFVRRIILNRDPPDHVRLRAAMGRFLGAETVRRLAPAVRAFADELIGAAVARGRLEAVEELAFPLPVMVACDLIGVPAADRGLIRGWASDLGRAFTSVRLGPLERERGDAAVVALRDYVSTLVDDRAARPRADPDLATLLLAARPGLDARQEVVDNIVFLFFAGFETTVNLIATGCATFLAFPGELERLRADRSLVPSAVEELLRWDGPIQVTSRLVREPLEVRGQRLRSGRVVHLLLGSANRDPLRFRAPDHFDVGRRPNPHLAFGGGAHSCLGAALARLEVVAVVETLLDRCAVFAPDGPSVRREDPRFRSFDRIPIALDGG